jgi:hypothetical protein
MAKVKPGWPVESGKPPPPEARERKRISGFIDVPWHKVEIRHKTALDRFIYGGERIRAQISTNVYSIGYNFLAQEIEVVYGKGGKPDTCWIYSPYNVSEAMDMLYAKSRGEWVWRNLRIKGKGEKRKHQRSARKVW